MASLFTGGKFQALNAEGVVPGAKLYTYAAGTTTPLATYTNQGGLSANANPVICDTNGQADVWRSSAAYRMILKDADNVTIWDVDNIAASLSALDFADFTDPAKNAALIGFNATLSYPAKTLGKREALAALYVTDHPWNAVGDGDAIAVTGTDNHAAFAACIAYALAQVTAHGGIQTVRVPRGTYGTSQRIQIPSGVKLVGDGAFSTAIFPLSGFSDTAGVLNTVESGLGQPPSGIYDLAVPGNYFVVGNTPGVVLTANASSMERVWVGGFAFTHIKCLSTNQIISRCIIDNAITTANSVGIEIVSPGVQVDTCTLYAQETGISIHDVPTTYGKVPIQISNTYACNPIGMGYGLAITNNNSMPIMVSDFVAMSDLTTGYAGAGVSINNSPNVHISHSRVEFPAPCTQTQTGFLVQGTSADVTLDNCSTKYCNIGIALQASYTYVRGGAQLGAIANGVHVNGAGIHNTIDGVTARAGGTGFTQTAGADKHLFQNCVSILNTTGFNIAAAAGTHTYLKNNHADSSTTDYVVSGSTNLVHFQGNTNALGAVEGPATTVTITGAAYTVGCAEDSLIANFAGTVTLTLPSAAGSLGRVIQVRTITANTVVSASSNVVPLVGGSAATAILAATAGKWATLRSDGTNWQISAGG